MRKLFIQIPLFMLLFTLMSSAYAVDSYRYAHVTIETPWAIFIFLLLIILLPFVLMAVLYWYFATKKSDGESAEHE
ncbi:MAG: hypothetical protein RRB22_06380 [Gammaproteobacteria bacterium]|nr:hypothetical protein [Gammaproteobacteria bacterium]